MTVSQTHVCCAGEPDATPGWYRCTGCSRSLCPLARQPNGDMAPDYAAWGWARVDRAGVTPSPDSGLARLFAEDDLPPSFVAHTQAQRLAAMMEPPALPTAVRSGDVLTTPGGTAAMLPDAPEIDPRTAAEDRCRTFWESCTSFEKATLRWLSGVDGWTDAKALDVRTREWRRAK